MSCSGVLQKSCIAFASMLMAGGAHAAAGDLDCAFGGSGKVFTDFGGEFEGAMSLRSQSDGKIVASGSSTGLLDAFYSTLLVLTDGAMIAAGSGIGGGGDPDLLLSRLSVEEGAATSCAASGGGGRRGGGAVAWLSLIFLSLCGVFVRTRGNRARESLSSS